MHIHTSIIAGFYTTMLHSTLSNVPTTSVGVLTFVHEICDQWIAFHKFVVAFVKQQYDGVE